MKVYELVLPDDEELGVVGISLVNDPAVDFFALKLAKEHIFDEDTIKLFLENSSTPLKYDKNYALLHVEDIENDDEVTINLSSEDNQHYEIRYRYSGPKDSKNRSFCKELLNWNREWTIDEIELLNDLVMPGMGPRGTNSYEVLKYGGGVHCRHRFQRLVYEKKTGEKYNYDEAIKRMPRNIVKQIKKLPKEVDQIASASNNYWRLNYSNEAKRTLTQPILIPDQKLIRANVKGEPSFVFASAATIEETAKRFFKNNYHQNSWLDHDDNQPIEGVFVFESWIVGENDKAKELGFDVPPGTWMVTVQLDEEAYNKYITEGEIKINGLSVDSLFRLEEKTDNQQIKLKKENQKMKKDFLQKIKKAVKIKLNSELTVVDSELGYGFTGDIIGATLVDVEGNVIADFSFSYEGINYRSNAEGIIDLAEAEVEVEMSEEDVIEITEDLAELVTELVTENGEDKEAKIAELEAKIAELEAKLNETVEEVVEFKKSTPKKLGFKKEANKKESYTDTIRRLIG